MSTGDVLIAASELLQQAVAELAVGNDLTPASLFAMEALLSQALARGIAPTEIRAVIEKLLPAGGVMNIGEHDQRVAVTLQLWQQRAPVVPST